MVQSPYFLNAKFQASSHLLWLHSLVCVGTGQKPERWFSHDAAHLSLHGEKKSAAFDLFLGICNKLSVNEGVPGVLSTERLEPGVGV